MRIVVMLFIVISIVLAGCQGRDVHPSDPYETTVLATRAVAIATEVPTEPGEIETQPTESPATEPVPVVLPQAEQVTGKVEVFLNGKEYLNRATDDNIYSRNTISADSELSVFSAEAFSALYIKWDTIPGEYYVFYGDEFVTCGQDGFLHEYITLPVPVKEVTISFGTEPYKVLCDLFLYTEGTPPRDVQVWQKPAENADILVFPTHSDDESLFFGPLIAYYSIQRQLTVQTAFMVDHLGYPQRGHERLDALWELGVRNYPILGTAKDTDATDLDAALQFYRRSGILEWQVELIRRFRPLVVVGHDTEGEYGNGGHKVNTHYLIQAAEAASDPEQCPESAAQYGTWDVPKLYLHLYRENQIVLDVNAPLEMDPEGRTAFEIAEDAFSHHISQHWLSYRVRQGSEWPQMDCTLFGLCRSLTGSDSGDDIMENLEGYR